jgi:hypothetical protein
LVTAVALYGTKAGAVRRLLETVQEICSEKLGERFRPYTLDQVHGTVIRLDGVTDPQTGTIVNQHYLEFTGIPRAMDYARALEILTAYLTPPLRIRIGGHRPNSPTKFLSREQHPFERMFSAQDGAFVLVGWPVGTVMNGISRRPLDELRRKMNDANILHWYHRSSIDIDNDFHLVIGHYNGVWRHETTEAVGAVRMYLAQHPIQIDVGVDQIAIIATNSPTLVPAQFIGRFPIDPAEIGKLYS